MIHHETTAYADVADDDAFHIELYQLSQLNELRDRAVACAKDQVDRLYADGATFSEDEVFANQYNGFFVRVGKLAVK